MQCNSPRGKYQGRCPAGMSPVTIPVPFDDRLDLQWTVWEQLDDLGFLDDIVLSRTDTNAGEDGQTLTSFIKTLSEIMKIHSKTDDSVIRLDKALEDVESFTYSVNGTRGDRGRYKERDSQGIGYI